MPPSSPVPRNAPARSGRKERPARPLSREGIVQCALALVDREGLQALSMRRLGAVLGVDPMAVYHHLPNKEALLDAIVEAVMGSIDLALDRPQDPPEERILVAARAYRDAMLAHGNALPIVLSRGPATEAALRPVELLLGVLGDAGLGPEQALAGMNALAAAVRGMVGMAVAARPHGPELATFLAQLPAGQFPHLRAALGQPGDPCGAGFEFGVRALARGLLTPEAGPSRRPGSLQGGSR